MIHAGNGKRGEKRIAELEERFPGIPRSAIVKADAFREGVAWTPDPNVIGRWAIPHTHMIFDWDHDRGRLRDRTAARVRDPRRGAQVDA